MSNKTNRDRVNCDICKKATGRGAPSSSIIFHKKEPLRLYICRGCLAAVASEIKMATSEAEKEAIRGKAWAHGKTPERIQKEIE